MRFQETEYSNFAEALRGKAGRERIPCEGAIEITHRCNLSCKHCYCCLGASDSAAGAMNCLYVK